MDNTSELTGDIERKLESEGPKSSGRYEDTAGREGDEALHAKPFRERSEKFDNLELHKLTCSAQTRMARDTFIDACEHSDSSAAEASFAATKHTIEDLWGFAKLRGHAFQDILGLIQAAIKHKDLSEFNTHQRDALRLAFVDLATWFIDDDDASQHRLRFAQTGIDILGPIQNQSDYGLRITIERIAD